MNKKASVLREVRAPAQRSRAMLAVFLATAGALLALLINSCNTHSQKPLRTDTTKIQPNNATSAKMWKAPDPSTLPPGEAGKLITYGGELLTHTGKYFGPNGSIARISNGMNCQNCHLDAGTKFFSNNYARVASGYPRLSPRAGRVVPASERVIECFQRSLNGTAPDTSAREVQAMLAYMKWVGKGVKKGQKLFGSATEKLPFMDHAANPAEGQKVFISKCRHCHGAKGDGLLAANKRSYVYPPLWGPNSYNDGAGMYRLSNFAGFVKNNMPYGATYLKPQLTNEEAWNVAAFVNSQPRPHKDQRKDWRDARKKPIDFPFGPYADNFSEEQHKYGPFQPIQDALTQ